MNAYNALTTPYYGLISLGNDCKTYLDKILILQERALRLIYSANTQHDAIPSGLFVKAKVLILNVLYYESVFYTPLINLTILSENKGKQAKDKKQD